VLSTNVSPNTVLANALNKTVDLLRPRIAIRRPKSIEFIVGTQINGSPHIGTNLTQCAAFLLAREVRNQFSIDTSVTFSALDNAPYNIELDPEMFHSYQITYRHALGEEAVEALTHRLYGQFFDTLSERTGVDYVLQRYSQQQEQPGFRRTFLDTLQFAESLRWCISPANGTMHLRIPCPACHKSEKRGERTKLKSLGSDSAIFEAVCFDHGRYEAVISEGPGAYLDLSTLYRNVVKEAQCSCNTDKLAVMVKGGDWAFACQLIDWSLGVLGYRSVETPVRCFTPQIVTDDGAKLSKSLINQGAMEILPDDLRWLVGTENYDGDVDDYCDAVIGIVTTMLSDPKSFFRSYSYKEIDKLMKQQNQEELRSNRARLIRIYRKYFDLIASGRKTIEIRVGYSSMRRIKPGQELRFACQNEFCLTKVIAVREYQSFEDLFKTEDWRKVNPDLAPQEQLREVGQIFGKDKEALGVLAIEITRIE
jgi:ASC-1-like (ASCH) protein